MLNIELNFALFGAFIAGIVLTCVFNALVSRRAKSFQTQAANAAGRSKKAAQGERLTAAMAEAMQMSKDENFLKDGKPDWAKIGMTLLPRYPDVAFLVAKELGFDGLKGLI